MRRAGCAAAAACLFVAALVRAQPSRRILIGASGDVLFHTRVVDAAARGGGFDTLFAPMREIVGRDDLAFANLETPLSVDRDPARGDPPILGAPPEAAGALARIGLDVMSVANNHAWDQRVAGLQQTLGALREARIAPVGAAPEATDAPGPIVIERRGIRVAFVAWTMDMQGHPGTRRPAIRVAEWEPRAARATLERARSQADLVVASMHWGLAYRHDDRSEQRTAAEWLVRHGADLVLGHGPHVLQRVERVASDRGEALIAYSLGNLISNQGYLYRLRRRDRSAELPLREPATRDGVWLRVAVELDGERVRIAEVGAVPTWTENNHFEQQRRRDVAPIVRWLPHRAVADEELRAERRRAIERALGPVVRLEP